MNALPNESDPDALAQLTELAQLTARARAVDGQPPFSDQSLVEWERGERTLLTTEHGAAIVSADEVEFVVDPDHRGQGHGTAVVERVLAEHPSVTFAWAHGDHPASRALAVRFGFTPVRTLLQLQTPLDNINTTTDSRLRSFRPGDDDAAWLRLNSQSFAHHPEQGKLTQRDLDDRTAEPWFDANDFLLLDDHGTLIGFCWLKVEGDDGEFYAVGIDPARQGEGLGRVLMDAGLARLRERGIRIATLYVEADNTPALALYRRYGFTQKTIDIQYQRTIR